MNQIATISEIVTPEKPSEDPLSRAPHALRVLGHADTRCEGCAASGECSKHSIEQRTNDGTEVVRLRVLDALSVHLEQGSKSTRRFLRKLPDDNRLLVRSNLGTMQCLTDEHRMLALQMLDAVEHPVSLNDETVLQVVPNLTVEQMASIAPRESLFQLTVRLIKAKISGHPQPQPLRQHSSVSTRR